MIPVSSEIQKNQVDINSDAGNPPQLQGKLEHSRINLSSTQSALQTPGKTREGWYYPDTYKLLEGPADTHPRADTWNGNIAI